MGRRPNFFIVGAPKSGTTAIAEYLRAHPRVFVSRPKEPHFFSKDLHRFPNEMIRSEIEYARLFAKADDRHLAVGEASVFYLSSPCALREIHRYNPAAKIIAILRNPVDMVRSLHSHYLFSFEEDEEEFEMAWRLQDTRRAGLQIPKTCRTPPVLQYRQIASYAAQVKRIYRFFPPDQVRILLFDDFVLSPKRIYETILSFLGVPSDDRQEFPKINEAKYADMRSLALFDHRPPAMLRRFVRATKRLVGMEHRGLLKHLYTRKRQRDPLPESVRAGLVEEFRGDILELAELLQRDLSKWLRVPRQTVGDDR